MKGSLQVGKIAGIPIRLHWSLVLLVIFAMGPGVGVSVVLSELAWIAAIFACVLIHELGHSIFARHRGYKVRDIVLLPLGGVSEIVGISNSARDEMTIALIGPLTNCAIALLLVGIAASRGLELWPPTLFGREWLVRVMWANVMLGGFNLLPALPLDGGRALRGFLARSQNRATATTTSARIATAIAVAMIFAGLLVDFWLALIGVIVLVGARSEERMALVGATLRDVKVKDVMVADPSGLQVTEPVASAAPFLRAFPHRAFAVLDGTQVVGIVSVTDLDHAPITATLRDVADTTAARLDADDFVYPKALDAFAESRRSSLVVESDGRSVGVLYASDVESELRDRTTRATASSPWVGPRS